MTKLQPLHGVNDRGWFNLLEWRPGAWQQDSPAPNPDVVMAQATVFACMTLIKSDIGKLRPRLMEMNPKSGIWSETISPAFSPLLRKPNRFQTWQKFIEQWVLSLLSNGNAYVLKARDNRSVVTEMFVLDPCRVRPLVAPDGSVYYQLQEDELCEVTETVTVPASEIIHDRLHCLFHPLVGISPIFACGLSALQALKIQNNSRQFFENMSRPSGILTAPSSISDEIAARLKEHWENNYKGDNIGKIAVLGDGLKYEAMTVTPVDAQLVDQLKLSAEQVCATFHVPAYMVNAGPIPANSNVEALNRQYYDRCLQTIIESIEAFLSDGLGLGKMSDGKELCIELDLDGLLRMDTASLTAALKDQVGAGITSPNEARRRLNMEPVVGGNSPMVQQQNFSLSALHERDQNKPFAKPAAPPPAAPAAPADGSEEDQTDKALHLLFRKAPEELLHA